MIAAADRADLMEQIAAALDLAVESHFEAGRLLGAVAVLARRLADPQVEAVENTNSDEVYEMEEVKEVPEVAVAEVPDPIVDHQALPDGIARISAARLRTITGLSPGEFRTLASMPDDEFEKAQQVASPNICVERVLKRRPLLSCWRLRSRLCPTLPPSIPHSRSMSLTIVRQQRACGLLGPTGS
jgi:hypothetical protein